MKRVGHRVFQAQNRRDRGGFGPQGQEPRVAGPEDLNDLRYRPLSAVMAWGGASLSENALPFRSDRPMPKANIIQNVLIIDPAGIITRVMTTMLTELGWGPVETVTTPVDALSSLREKRFGLVITDWAMEPMDAGEFIKSLRADIALASTPVMVVTGNPDPSQFIIATDAGADAYALVPFDVETLALKLDQIRLRRTSSPRQMGD